MTRREIPQERMDAVDLKVMADIGTHGWSDMMIFPTEESPGEPFNYTVGFAEYEHPDMIIIGLHGEQAHGVLSAAFEQIQKGTRYGPDEYYDDILVGFPVGFVEVLDPMGDEYMMSMTNRIYGEVKALQLCWPDEHGKFPWNQEEFTEEYREHQPLLGVWRGV